MPRWKIGDETYSLSEIFSEIKKRDSEIATALVEMIKVDRDSNGQTSIALTIISKVKKSNQNIYMNHSSYPGTTYDMCEESFNDALLTIFTKIDSFDSGKSSLNTWLSNMIYWAFQKNYRTFIRERKGIVEPSIDEEDSASWLTKFISSSEDISKGVWQGDLIMEAFRKLSFDEQALIRYCGNDMEPTQLVNEGYVNGVSVNAVGVQMHRARKKFLSYLDDAGWKK
jgi:DNA-directed RNA polymerase specialized sigma24 family protein